MTSLSKITQEQLRRLRVRGAYEEARILIRGLPDFDRSGSLQRLLHEHADFWWEPIVGRRVRLERRGPADAEFVRACWADTGFMQKFNRLARPLPDTDDALRAILSNERAGLWSESRALHWAIYATEKAVGFISATDYSARHRRCEFLIGILGQPPSALAVEAAYLAVAFLQERAGIERLTAYFYAENEHAAKVAEKFGFKREGVLRGYMLDSDGGRSDLLVSGLLLTESPSLHELKVRARVLRKI